jgi:DNA polymerase III delta prime subunit
MEVDGSIISRIDENYIENNTVPENSPAIDAYYRLDYDVDIISKAVCSNNVVVDDGLLKAMIQEIKKANKVLFICGEGGIGKTTLLLQLSVELSKENPVYFAQLTAGTSAEKFKDELDRTFSISYNTDALCYLFIDNPFSNGEIIETIHNWLQYNDKIIVILADRVLNIQLLFDSKYVLPYWKEASTYVLIGQGKTNFFKNMHPSNRIVELNQSECWKRKVVDKMISNISIKVGIERALLEVHITDKIARKLTPYEIFYNACIKYNKLQTKDENGIDIRPKLKFSWDEWNDLFCKVCPEFARVFSVIAALALFSIPTSVDVISKYSSLRRSEVVSFLEKIPKKYSAPVKYQDSLITLRHDLIADFYFATFDSDSARQVVETTLLDVIDILDDDSVIKFEKMFLGNALSIEILRRIG